MAHLIREFEGMKESDEWMHHEKYPKSQVDYKVIFNIQQIERFIIFNGMNMYDSAMPV